MPNQNPTCIVTGANAGLGLALCKQLAQANYQVIATLRNLSKSRAIDELIEQGLSIEIVELDVTKTETVQACVDMVMEKYGQIDVLVNNAGAGFVRTTEQASEDDIKWVMDLNFHGVVRCTKAVLPHMREARAGRIINISSVGGLVGQPFNEIYCAAKFAVEGFTEALACYVQPNFNIKFTAIEPGGISSEFADSALAHFVSTGGMLDDEYKPILETYIGGAQQRSASGEASEVYQTPEEVADVVIQCLAQDDPPIRLRTSDWAEGLCKYKTQADPDGKLQQADVIDRFL